MNVRFARWWWIAGAGLLAACGSTQKVRISVQPGDVRSSVSLGDRLVGIYDGTPLEAEAPAQEDRATFTLHAEPVDPDAAYQATSQDITAPRSDQPADVTITLDAKTPISIATDPPVRCRILVDRRVAGDFDGSRPLRHHLAVLGESATIDITAAPEDTEAGYQVTTAPFTVQRDVPGGTRTVVLKRMARVAVEILPALVARVSFEPAGDGAAEQPLGQAEPERPFEGWVSLDGDEISGKIHVRPDESTGHRAGYADVHLVRGALNRAVIRLPAPPVANFELREERDGPPVEQVLGGSKVLLDATTSRDRDGAIVEWRWKVFEAGPDGVLPQEPWTGSGEVLEHVFEHEGSARIVLEVADDSGLKTQLEKQVRVKDDRPLAVLDVFPALMVQAGDTVVLSGRRSAVPPRLIGREQLVSVNLDFGDGTPLARWVPEPDGGPLEARPILHRYERPGEYTAKLTVTASNGESRVVRAGLRVAASQANEDLLARAVRDLLPDLEPVVSAAKGSKVVLYNLDHAETQPDDPLLGLVEEELFTWLVSRGVILLERDRDVVARAVFDRNGRREFSARRELSRKGEDAGSFEIGSLRFGEFEFAGDISLPLGRLFGLLLDTKPVGSAGTGHGAHEAASLAESVEVSVEGPFPIDLGNADLVLAYRVERAYVDALATPGSPAASAADPDDIRGWRQLQARARLAFRLVDVGAKGGEPFRVVWAGTAEGVESQHIVPGDLRRVTPPRDGSRYPTDWLGATTPR